MSLPLVLAALAPLATPDCPIDRLVYALDGAPRFTAGFERPPNPPGELSFWLKTPERTYRFRFVSPNGYGGAVIIPERRDGAEDEDAPEPPVIDFDAFGPELDHHYDPPRAGRPAPARLFVRRLGPALWYDPVALSGGDETARPESMPIGMFKPAKCRAVSDQP